MKPQSESSESRVHPSIDSDSDESASDRQIVLGLSKTHADESVDLIVVVVVLVLVLVVDVVVDGIVVVGVVEAALISVESAVPLSSQFVLMARFKTKTFATIETASKSIRLDAKYTTALTTAKLKVIFLF